MSEESNSIYEDRVVKYTINIPIELYSQMKARAKKLGFYHLSPLIRYVLEREFHDDNPMSMTALVKQFLDQKAQQNSTIIKEIVDHPDQFIGERKIQPNEKIKLIKPRKYMGFISGLRRNSFVNSWFQKNK